MHLILSPLTWALVLPPLLALLWRHIPHALRWLMLLAQCVCVLTMCPVVANALVEQIESRVPASPACTSAPPATIVVLAAGFEREPASAEDFAALHADTIRRAVAGLVLWRRAPAQLVLAGGGPYAVSESAVLQGFLQNAGVPAAQVRREERSQTTWENAFELRRLEPALPARVWLVSSALHLPRALIAFRAAGFEPCAFASDRRYQPPGGPGYYLPQSSALRKTEDAVHELVGELVYRWRAARASSSSR